MKKNSRLKSFFAILLAVSMIFQQSSLTVLATDDTYVEDATATPTPSESEAETYATEGAEPVVEKQEEPQQMQETPAAEQAQEPTEAPAEQPTEAPAEQPTEAPAEQPTEAPAEQPTEAPAAAPTEAPATEPTAAPAAEVTEAPAAPEATATPAAEATATPTPEVSAPPSETPTPTPEVTETPAETTEFSDVSVDNAIANVSLSTPISEKAIFVAKQYDEDSEYFDNAIGAVMNWAGQNNLALTEAVVYDLHFENEDGTPYPYGDNATVNLQFNNPILNELEYDNVENVKTYVLHITENGVQDVNGGIAQNGSGAVTGVTIQTNGFSPFVIVKAGSGAVMAVQEGLPSTSLADFITDVKFTDAKTDENGKLILSIGSEYSFDMSFAEVPGVRQLDVENNLVLEYPTQLTPSVQSGTFDIEVIKGKNKYIVSGNTYEVINNKVVVKINKNDTNYEHLKDASNVAFNLHLKAKVSENATGKEIKFNDQVKKDVTFKSDASVSVEKTGTYDKTRGKFIYTVKVTSTGTSKNVKVTDRITGTLLKYADDVVASPDKGSVSATPINNGFVYEIPIMNDGEVITLTYSADIDYSKLPKGAKSFTVDETKNTVSAKGDNTPKSDDKSKDFNNETIATPIKKSGKAEEVKDGKQTSTWTIIVNEDANEYVGGSTVTDILKQNDKAPTDYSGGGLTVNIYNKNGDKVGTETPLWGNGVTKTESGWTYNLPKNANNTPYKYEIIYTTVTDISSVYQDNLKIENEAEHNGESTSGEVSPISKGDKFEVTKDHENATKDSVDWTVTIKIPDTGFNNSFSVTDSLPFTWNNGVPCKDSYMAGTMKVDWNGTTLVEGTHYSINPEDTGSNSIQLKLNFKNVAQLFPKVNAGTNRTLTLTYKTKPDSNWPESESHNNTVTVSGDGTDKTDTDSYKLSEHKIKKEVDGTRTIDGMPAFGFKVQLQGVDSDTITISDNFFDTELFEVYVGRSDVWGMMRFGGGDKPEEAEAAANGKSLGGTVSATPTSTGADFTITNVAKKGNSYYNYYVLRYFLKVKDVAALKKLQQMAADSENHTALISNIATWGDISSEKVSHTFELKPVTKETVDVGSGNDYKASFKIVINPDKLKLNGGNQIDVKDVITVTEGAGAKVRLIPDSLKITLDPAGDYSTDYSEDRTTLNIKIPDECKATITYDAKVDGKGTVKYNNTVDISGGYTASSGEKTVYIESIAGGTAEVFAYTLVKRDAKTKAALNGAKFQLFDVTDNKLLTAFDAKKNRIPLVFTTNENGIVEIRHSDETVSGWSLIEGHRYRLEEIEAPDGYGIADPVTFTVVSSKANAGETIPADGIFNGEEIDVYDAKAEEVDLTATKELTGRNLKDGEFSFELTPDSHNPASDKNAKKTVQNTADGNISFGKLKFTEAGTYKYTVSEITGNDDTITYDNKSYTVTIVVEEGEHGALNIASKTITLNSGAKSEVKFTNAYTPKPTTAQIEAEKTVNGKAATGSQFHFTLTPKTDGDKNRSQNVTNVDGKITFAALTYDKAGVYEYEVAEVQENLPNGYMADKTVYKVTVTVTDDMSGQLKAAVSYRKGGETADKLTFANTYKASVDLQLKAQKFMKVEAEQLGTFEFELKDADGKVIETVKNDEKGAISFSKLSYTEKDAGRTFTYTVNEKIPSEADPYIYDKTVYTVTVNVEDNRDGTLKLTTKVNGKDYTATAMKFVNDSTKVTITKVNDTDRNALLGAKLQIVDAKDKVVEEWTTDGNPHVIIGKLILGETYKLVEKEAPNGYKIADPITFVMQSDGTITVNAKPVSENQLTMVDSKLHFNVNKVELGSGKEVEGAHLVVIDKETGKTVDEWVSEKDKTHDFGPKLEAGKSYILRETVAPAGYKYATDIEFTVKKDGTIETNAKTTTDTDGNKVYLVEDDTTKVTITKVDALGNQLSGVVLEIQDKDGMVIDTWTTSTKDNPHVITGKLILGETYKLVEKSAPAGYTLADPVEFTVSENDIDNKVEMKNIYSASGSLNLTAKKILTTTETPLAAGQFTFELRDKDGTVLQTKTNDADGNVTFDQIKYNLVKDAAYKDNTDKKVDNTGEYQYTVNEVKGDAAGYTYDDTIYTINVTVTDAGNGTLTVTPVIHSSKATSEDATATGMEFTNTYTTSGQIVLGATKTLEGQTLEAEQFSFQATEMDVDGKAVENGYSETVKNADGGAITFPIITYKESGTHYYQITEVKDEKPAYQYDESKYVVKVDVTDDNAGKLTAKVTSVTKNGELVKSEDLIGAVTFTNTYSASADLELKAQKSMKVEAEQLGTFEFELKDADGKVIETVKNDEKGAISFSKLSYTEKDAGKTFTYTVNEKLPSEADTYVYDKTVYTVTVNVEDNRDGTLKLTTKVNGGDYTETVMKFVNDTTKVTISKVDDTTLKALAGAKLQVVDDQDKVVEEWTSDGTPHVITAKLVLGKTYKLVEEEAPSGYEIAEPITFTVDADDTKNAVEMKDAMTKGKTAAIEITKELKLNDALAGAKDMTFYAALFADAECTISASDVKALEFKNASSSTVTFTNLDLGRTYYVSETDATGKAIDSGMTPDEKVYVPVYPQGQAITVTEDGAKSSITFENQFSEWPDGFYKIATLNVTKKLLGAAGNALESDEIFYAGIFDDKECTTLSTRTEKNILTLDLAGGSTVSESTQAVVIPDEAFTLYVAETDAEGNLVDGTEGFRYAVTVENGNVLFDENNLNAEVTIINQEQPEATPTVTPEETITPTPTPGTSTGVKTGDDTPIGFYMALLFVAALAIEETTRRRRKKEQD